MRTNTGTPSRRNSCSVISTSGSLISSRSRRPAVAGTAQWASSSICSRCHCWASLISGGSTSPAGICQIWWLTAVPRRGARLSSPSSASIDRARRTELRLMPRESMSRFSASASGSSSPARRLARISSYARRGEVCSVRGSARSRRARPNSTRHFSISAYLSDAIIPGTVPLCDNRLLCHDCPARPGLSSHRWAHALCSSSGRVGSPGSRATDGHYSLAVHCIRVEEDCGGVREG
ncbi:exported hypothetical protein [Frankia sp. AgKG'84/4]